MTRSRTARLAGFAYLFYVVVGISHEVLASRATAAEGAAATIARVAGHVTDLRLSILLTILENVSALVLAVTLYGITRDQDQELATLAMVCRVAEGVLGSLGVPKDLGLLWLASAPTGAGAPDVATTKALGAFLLMPGGPVGAIFFAVGSTIFAYLLLRGRLVPSPIAGLGVVSSALLVVGLPLQVAGFFSGPLTGYQWLPAFAYAIVIGLWLAIKGVTPPAGTGGAAGR